MNWIDTHAHLYLEAFEEDQLLVVQKALDCGIEKIMLPNIDLDSFPKMMSLCSQFQKNLFPMIGLHPCDVHQNWESIISELQAQYQPNTFIAVGETGIDLYWDKSTLDWQKEAFKTQIKWAKEWKLPIVIHARESTAEILEILDENMGEDLTGIFHCFSGNESEAKRIMEYKTFKLGIGGSVTYKNSSLPSILKNIPLSYIVLETDSPFLPPTPHRGKRNESSYIPIIGDFVATIYEIPTKEIAKITTQNALEIFKFA